MRHRRILVGKNMERVVLIDISRVLVVAGKWPRSCLFIVFAMATARGSHIDTAFEIRHPCLCRG